MENEVVFAIVLCAVVVCIGATGITYEVTQGTEREYACIELGYDGYNGNLESCFNKGETLVMYPYETVFDRIE